MTTTRSSGRPVERQDLEDAEVSTLELFFDLVFVFALTQITAFMAEDLAVETIVRGVLVLMMLWWGWGGYVWLANVTDPDQPHVKVTLLAAMGAMFLLALCIPEAYDDAGGGGLHGPTVLAVAYLVFRLLHFLMFWLVAREDDGLRGQLARFAPTAVASSIVLLVAANTHGHTQTLLWVLAMAADYLGTALIGASGWRLPVPSHFSERYGLIVIIALGESIVAVGVGVAALPISWPILVASSVALTLAAALWWAYFDVSALLGEQALAAEPVETRSRLGRNAYSFAHLPLVAGVVLVALGLKKILEYVGDEDHHELSDPLTGVALGALVGGAALYFAGHLVFKWIVAHEVSLPRAGATVVLLVAWALVGGVPALGQLGIVTGVVVVSIVVESRIYAERRRQIRREHAD